MERTGGSRFRELSARRRWAWRICLLWAGGLFFFLLLGGPAEADEGTGLADAVSGGAVDQVSGTVTDAVTDAATLPVAPVAETVEVVQDDVEPVVERDSASSQPSGSVDDGAGTLPAVEQVAAPVADRVAPVVHTVVDELPETASTLEQVAAPVADRVAPVVHTVVDELPETASTLEQVAAPVADRVAPVVHTVVDELPETASTLEQVAAPVADRALRTVHTTVSETRDQVDRTVEVVTDVAEVAEPVVDQIADAEGGTVALEPAPLVEQPQPGPASEHIDVQVRGVATLVSAVAAPDTRPFPATDVLGLVGSQQAEDGIGESRTVHTPSVAAVPIDRTADTAAEHDGGSPEPWTLSSGGSAGATSAPQPVLVFDLPSPVALATGDGGQLNPAECGALLTRAALVQTRPG